MVDKWIWDKDKRRKIRRDRILKRDNYSCQVCGYNPFQLIIGIGKPLHLHHIDKNDRNNHDSNMITLCPSCHAKIHNKERARRCYNATER